MKPKRNYLGNQYAAQGIDACQTPPYAIGPLLPYLKPGSTIWEPAAGEGYMADALERAGFRVLRSDIITGQNFFQYQPEEEDWTLVTNPPYGVKYPWTGRCYELGRPFALLMPVETIGTQSGQILFKKFGVEIIWLDQRINFKMPNKGWDGSVAQFPVAWFTHGLNIGRENTFAQLRPEGAQQLELF